MYVKRLLAPRLLELAASPLGRGLILTGARQTGKTTLLQRELVPEYEYHSFDELLSRESLEAIPASEWIRRGASCVFDEAQKAPAFLGTVKRVLDDGPREQRVILSGSAQIQLLSGVRETLAGRVVTCELYPLTVAEMAGVERPLVVDLLACSSAVELRRLLVEAAVAASDAVGEVGEALRYLLAFGGMPALLKLEEIAHRWIWLEEYCQSYLQRDLADLGRVQDLDDFVRLERVAAERTAGLVNYADLARDADLSPVTAKKYLRYLELSYQAFTLEAYRGRAGQRLTKAPRLHWADLGVQRVLARNRDGLSGAQLETAVVGELHKLVRTLRLDAELSHFRTKDGREVDLLVRTTSGGYLAFEVKASERASAHDARHLRGLGELLDGPLLGGMVLYQGRRVHDWGDGLFALPVTSLFASSPARR